MTRSRTDRGGGWAEDQKRRRHPICLRRRRPRVACASERRALRNQWSQPARKIPPPRGWENRATATSAALSLGASSVGPSDSGLQDIGLSTTVPPKLAREREGQVGWHLKLRVAGGRS